MATPYKRLPGKNAGAFTLTTLWDGGDHLLLVESNRVSESYRRFFYHDIQAVVVCETKKAQVTSGVLAGLALAAGAPAFFVNFNLGVTLGVTSGILLMLALVNFLRGPTCLCTVQTAVQTQRLASLNRVRVARKVLAQIQPKIEAAQAEKPK